MLETLWAMCKLFFWWGIVPTAIFIVLWFSFLRQIFESTKAILNKIPKDMDFNPLLTSIVRFIAFLMIVGIIYFFIK